MHAWVVVKPFAFVYCLTFFDRGQGEGRGSLFCKKCALENSFCSSTAGIMASQSWTRSHKWDKLRFAVKNPKIRTGLPSFSIRARTETTLTHILMRCTVGSFIIPLVQLYTFSISVHAITLIRIGYRHKSHALHTPHIPLGLVTMH